MKNSEMATGCPRSATPTARSTVRCSTASAAVWRKPSACARIGSSGRIAATATKNDRPERDASVPGGFLCSADDLVLEVFTLDLAADLDLRRQQCQRHRVQLVAGNIRAAQVDVIAVKADDLIVPWTPRTSLFRFLL